MRQTLIDVVGLAGLAAVAEGMRQIYPPAALIVIGAGLLIWAVMASRK
jgi:hypothetical protein